MKDNSDSGPVADSKSFLGFNWSESKLKRAFRHRDFRLLWFGAFISFIGSWIQTVAQGFLVYDLTGSKEKLALVALAGTLPVSILGLYAGSIVDKVDKKLLLILTQVGLAAASIYLAVAQYLHQLKFEYIIICAIFTGIISSFEMPARQAVVGLVVPKEDLSAAIPFQALTFNLARVVGPAIGGNLLAYVGVEGCDIINAVSFLALIVGAMAMTTDMKPAAGQRDEGVWDLIMEGLRYTWHEPRLRRLLILEVIIAFFGLFYLAQLPAISRDLLHLDKAGLGHIYSVIGFGAVAALGLNTATSDKPIKGTMIKIAMTLMAISMVALAAIPKPALAFVVFFLMGMCAVIQFNTTNTLFQIIAPEKLRGRVISMHIWALSGLGPFGSYLFGWISEHYGIPLALRMGAGFVFAGVVILGWGSKETMEA